MSRICDFCQKHASHFQLQHSRASRLYKVYFCFGCQAEYVEMQLTKSPWARHLYTTINDQVYRWTVHAGSNKCKLCLIKEPGIPGLRENKGIDIIKDFPADQLEITPANINEKIRTILLFL